MDMLRAGAGAPTASGPVLAIDDTVLELLPVAVCVCDAAGQIIRYNRKASELWGRSPRHGDPDERFCGAHRIYHSDGRPLPHNEAPIVDVLRTGRPVQDIEAQIEQPDGRRLWVQINIVPVRNDTGDVTGAITCLQDITERKKAEVAAEEVRALLRAVIETTPECIKVVAADSTLLHMNPAGLRMVGADGANTVEGACTLNLIAPEYRREWQANHDRVCTGESVSWEFDIVGLHGMRRHMETHAAPLRMPDGTTAQLAVTRDVTRRKRDEAALRESERRLRELLDALPAAVYTTDSEGRITFYNEAAAEFWGHRPELGHDQWCGSWRLYWPDGTPLPHEECPMAVALKENRPVRDVEAVAERPDGTRVPFVPYPTPLRDASGALVGGVNMLVDISRHKRAEERQNLLIRELNHRVKNTLATVQSIAVQSFRGPDIGSRKWFEGRLMALSKTHDVLTRENWEGAGLREVVQEVIAPYIGEGPNRFAIDGPDLRLAPEMALPLSMAVHELCTNAAKYGALSNMEGQVGIRWTVARTEAGPRLHLRWAERGGPPVEVPKRRGFGSRMIERGLAHELSAEVRLEFAPSGVVCDIKAPLH
ncbi:MAG TPA: PAS domain S-box protein [Azospirillaceae bacterium]|nr:PAS domain S-box protein [Azospirillaceae bacterium]